MTVRGPSAAGRIAIALAWRPEWPVTVLLAAGWLAFYALGTSGVPADHQHGFTQPVTVAAMSTWALMSFVMMVPATLPAVRHVAFNSIQARRQRAMTVYVLSYLAVWMTFGLGALVLIAGASAAGASENRLLVLTLALASVWQLTRTKRRAVLACQRTIPFPPDGRRADLACGRFGVLQAWRCMRISWPLMLLMAVIGHSPLFTVAVTVAMLAEERARRRDRAIAVLGVLLCATTVVVAAISLTVPR